MGEHEVSRSEAKMKVEGLTSKHNTSYAEVEYGNYNASSIIQEMAVNDKEIA